MSKTPYAVADEPHEASHAESSGLEVKRLTFPLCQD